MAGNLSQHSFEFNMFKTFLSVNYNINPSRTKTFRNYYR